MRYRIIFGIFFWVCTTHLYAQSLSIEDLWKHIDQAKTVQEKKLNVEFQKEQLNIRKSERLPLIYGDANVQRNLIIPVTPVPAIAFDQSAAEGAIIPLKFSTKWNAKAGLQLEWDIFNPTAKNELKEDQISLEKAKIEELQELDTWRKDATLAYASIVLASIQYQGAIQDSTLFAEINKVNKDRFQAGRGSSDDYILSQQELERKRIRLHESWSVLQEANLELRRYYTADDVQFLSSNMEQILSAVGENESIDYEQNLIELDQKLSLVQLNGIKRQLLPSLSFNAYYGSQFFNNDLNLFNHSNWYGYSYANIGLKIPISAYLTNAPALRKAVLNEQIFGSKLENIKLNDEINHNQKKLKVFQAKQKRESLQKIAHLASQQKEDKLKAYQAGRTLLSEFNRSHSDYLKAQQDLWQSEYDLLSILFE